MRPRFPGVILARSTPSSSARRRATGLALIWGCAPAAARTSRSTMRPERPLPCSCAQSTPSSVATRRARGLMVGAAVSVVGAGDGRAGAVAAPDGGSGAGAVAVSSGNSGSSGISSPDSSRKPMTVPTGSVEPGAGEFGGMPSVPESSASISLRALSVSTVKRMSPAVILSPSRLIHSTRIPSSICQPRRGMTSSMAMRPPYSAARSRMAVAMSPSCGTAAVSSGGLYGIGVCRPLTRRIGASRSSKATSATAAAISAPMLPGA